MAETFIGFVCGLKSEAAALRAACPNGPYRVAVSGANAERAAAIAESFCHQGASLIVSLGVSGGLDPGVNTGDLIISSKIIKRHDGEAVPVQDDVRLARFMDRVKAGIAVDASPDQAEGPSLMTVDAADIPLLGSDDIIADAAQKAALFDKTGAAAVDMESHGAAVRAYENQVPFVAIRVVADPSERALPRSSLNAVTADGGVAPLRVLGGLLRRPGEIGALMKLGVDAGVADKRMRLGLGPILRCLFVSFDLG